MDGVSHPGLKTNPAVARAILEFWSQPREPLPAPKNSLISKLIEHFRSVSGITDASKSNFSLATTVFSFADGTSIRTWQNIVGVKHIFIANNQGKCEYAAFVGWIHSNDLQHAIDRAIDFFS